MIPTKFQVNWPFVSGKRKIDFQDGGHDSNLGFSIGTILSMLIYNSPRYFLLSFKSIGILAQELV